MIQSQLFNPTAQSMTAPPDLANIFTGLDEDAEWDAASE
jgi:hypothetical protein